MKFRFLLCVSLVACCATPVFAQTATSAPANSHGLVRPIARPFDQLAPGFAYDSVRNVGLFDAYASRPNGERVVFDGFSITRTAHDGTLLATLGTLPGFVFTSFVAVDPTDTFALVGESSTGVIYKVDLAGGGVAPLADLDFNFDAAFEGANHVLVSAATCGFGCGNELYRVHTSTGVATLIGTVTGPSGPLALAANGDLYYGIQTDAFPPPPGAFTIVRWNAALVTSGGLTNGNATTFVSGLDGAADLALEPVNGHVFVADSSFGSTGYVREFNLAGTRVAEIVETGASVSNLEFFDGTGPGAFQAFQPATSTTLRYRSTHFTTVQFSRVMHAVPQRPMPALAGPGIAGPGEVTLTIRGAAPNGTVGILVCSADLVAPIESAYDFGTFLFHTGMPLPAIRRIGEVPVDAAGNATWTYYNPGNLQGTRVLQAIVKDGRGVRVGSSGAVRD
ncbi:MAG: hypothetical protein ACKVWV_19605 [Planctomycetota bacterium]